MKAYVWNLSEKTMILQLWHRDGFCAIRHIDCHNEYMSTCQRVSVFQWSSPMLINSYLDNNDIHKNYHKVLHMRQIIAFNRFTVWPLIMKMHILYSSLNISITSIPIAICYQWFYNCKTPSLKPYYHMAEQVDQSNVINAAIIRLCTVGHYKTFTELSVPKKVLHGYHNTVTFRNYNHFDDCEFINDVKSNDLLNGNCKEVKWNEWKDAFLHICNAHAPTKTARLKVRSNT